MQGLLKYSDPIREKWDLFVMILSIFLSAWLPYEQAFIEHEYCSFGNLSVLDIFNYYIDGIFFLDILMNFNTT